MPAAPQSRLAYFSSRYRVDDSGCWIWTHKKLPKGYGIASLGRRGSTMLAHRLAWTLHFGPIAPGLCVCHRCDVPSCVNPEHLFLGTVLDNTRDMIAKGRDAFKANLEVVNSTKRAMTHCLRGHEFTESNTAYRKTGKRRSDGSTYLGRRCRACDSFRAQQRRAA